jgi:large subunit ribosomal protein L4
VNQKTKVLARKSALTYKAQESNIRIVEGFSIEAPKTKLYIDILNNLALLGKKTLLILPEYDQNIYLSSRNLPKTKVVVASDINTYDVMNADTLILAEGSVEKIEKLLTA